MKVAYIMKSEGLEYDDRIRKEIFSMRTVLKDVEFKIFAFCGKDNRTESGVLSYGVPYEFVSVNHRAGKRKDIFTMLLKEYDFYKQIKSKVGNYDLLWVCDAQPFFFPLFSSKPVIWDLHEIPATIIGGFVKNSLFHIMESRCRWLIHANQDRIDYLSQTGVICQLSKNLVLRNYPDSDWMDGKTIESESYLKFKEWIMDDEYIYLQGINCDARFPWETLSAIMKKRTKAVVIGNVPVEIKEKIAKIYPESSKTIYYTGQIVQSETAAFIANCKYSLVFYTTKTPNNRYCEPNRMFQCLAFGKPVVVGCNDSMASVINTYKNGIVLQSDGSIIDDILAGMNEMERNYGVYKEMAEKNKTAFEWTCQLPVIEKLFR